MRWLALPGLCLLGGCAGLPVPDAGGGLVLHYVRSNSDGSEPEHVVQFRPSKRDVAVYKWVSKCTTAAYVTAIMDEEVTEGGTFVAGKVARDGSQSTFGTLALDETGPALVVDMSPPGGERVQARHALKERPFLLYDFDFADLNAFLQVRRPRTAFGFALPVIWPGDPALFRDLGRLTATPAGETVRDGRRVLAFELRVEGSNPTTGKLLLDADRFFIVEADLGLPNHEEYRDFKLALTRVEHGGQAAFDALTRGQYAHCPA